MTPKTDSGSFSPDAATSSQSGQIGSKRQFDTFETNFFQQGDDVSAGVAVDIERFDEIDHWARRSRFMPSRQFMMGVAVGSTCIAIIGCIALWRSSRFNSHAAAAIANPAQVAPALANPAPMPVAPTPEIPTAAAPPAQAEPTPTNPVAAAAPAQAVPLAAPSPTQPEPAVAQAQAEPAPSPAAPAVAPPVPAAPAEKPLPAVVAAIPAKPEVVPEVVVKEKPLPAAPAAAADAPKAQIRCKKAISDKRNKEVLALCPDAFAADSSAADIAVALAKVEFDRGKSASASSWGQKAIAADPNAADAYVFIGGAEQSAGHRKAAKEAYKRYLQLAPSGRYAADLRAILSSL